MFKSLFASTVLASVALVSPAGAAEQPRSLHVSFADLDMAGAAGHATLARRVHQAAKSVCALEVPASLHTHRLERRCETAAWDRVADRVATAGNRPRGERIAGR